MTRIAFTASERPEAQEGRARLATRYQLWRIPADGIVTPPLAFPGAGEDAADPTLAWRTATAGIPSRPLLAYQSAAHIMLVDGFR